MVIKIEFLNAQKMYVAGEMVDGFIDVDLESFANVKTITVVYSGCTTVKWRTKCGQSFSSKRVHFMHEETVVGEPGGEFHRSSYETISSLPIVPFSYLLPKDIPSSFRGQCGSTVYMVQVDVTYKDHKSRRECEEFFVLAYPNYQGILRFSNPVKILLYKVIMDDKNDPTFFRVNISCPYSRFLVGDAIPFSVYVRNFGPASIENLAIQLKRISTFKAQTPKCKTKTAHEIIEQAVFGKIFPYTEMNVSVCIHISENLTPTWRKHASLINVSYVINAVYTTKNAACCVEEIIEIYSKQPQSTRNVSFSNIIGKLWYNPAETSD